MKRLILASTRRPSLSAATLDKKLCKIFKDNGYLAESINPDTTIYFKNTKKLDTIKHMTEIIVNELESQGYTVESSKRGILEVYTNKKYYVELQIWKSPASEYPSIYVSRYEVF